MREYIVCLNARIPLGIAGENEVTKIIWENLANEWEQEFGSGVVNLAAMRSTDDAPYPVSISIIDGNVEWVVSNADTEFPGIGKCELTYVVNDKVAKSKTWSTAVAPSITGDASQDPPPEYQSWVDSVFKEAAKIQEAIPEVTEADNGKYMRVVNGKWAASEGSSGGAATWKDLEGKPFNSIDSNTLTVNEAGVLQVNTTDVAEQDNTKPITSSGAYVILGNIDTLLSQI